MCQKCVCGAGGAYSAPQTPLLALRGLLLKGGEGMGGEKRRGKGRKQEGKGEREGKAYRYFFFPTSSSVCCDDLHELILVIM